MDAIVMGLGCKRCSQLKQMTEEVLRALGASGVTLKSMDAVDAMATLPDLGAAVMVVGVGLGLGYAIIQARWSLDFEAAFVCIALICSIGLLFEKVVFTTIERRVTEGLKDE